MDTPDWNELLRGVEELGHGAIVFESGDEEYTVAEVVVTDEEVKVILE